VKCPKRLEHVEQALKSSFTTRSVYISVKTDCLWRSEAGFLRIPETVNRSFMEAAKEIPTTLIHLKAVGQDVSLIQIVSWTLKLALAGDLIQAIISTRFQVSTC